MVSLAITMALESLREASQAVHDADEAAIQARIHRDALMRDARDADVSYRRICTLTGLSRERAWAIVNSGEMPTRAPARRTA